MPAPATPRWVTLLCVLTAVAVANATQQEPYRLGRSNSVETALLDFLAVDRSGRPILDLKANEVTLQVDGRSRPVATLQLVDLTEASGASMSLSGEPLPSPFGSNLIGTSRSIVVLIDEDSIRPGRERPTLAAVDELIAAASPRTRFVIAT